MTWDEYNILFHKEQLNLVAFKRLMDCDEEVLRLVNRALQEEREACAKVCEEHIKWPSLGPKDCANAIRVRSEEQT